MNTLPVPQLQEQGARCMECGVPFCHNGCPLGNLIPDWNDLVYRDRWRAAIDQLHATNNFPEFTGKLCPAPCEAACVLEIREGDAVTIKQIEVSIINRAFDEGWVVPRPPRVRDRPQRRGHRRRPVGPRRRAAAAPGRPRGDGLRARRGGRRARALRRAGLQDREVGRRAAPRPARAPRACSSSTGSTSGVDVGADELRERHDAVVIATGSRVPRDLPVPGRELDGVHYAMEYLYGRNRWVAGNGEGTSPITAAGKHVIVIGGGDTGADCVGNSHREGAASVTQIELLGEPPAHRQDDLTPWPRWPVKLRRSYAIKEGGEQDFAISTTKLTGSNGRVERDPLGRRTRASRRSTRSRAPRRRTRPTSSCSRWASCRRSRSCSSSSASRRTSAATAKAGAYATSAEGVFAAGDARRGQSLIVWAINEGRQCARVVDRYLNGLPEKDPREALTVGASERAGSTELGADPPQQASFGSGQGID